METSALSFARPVWLHALWLLPLGIALFWWAEQRRRALIGRIVAPKLRALLAGNTSPARRWFRGACVLGALGLLAVTLAGPRLGYDTLEVPHKGRDVIIAMDVSRSMLATDVAPTRLQRAKLLAEDLVSELGGDRLGLVAFAGSAFLQAPLTLDHGAVLAAVDELDTDLIPKGGTNLGAAIRTCEEAFGKAEGFSRAIVIISDGEELDADGLEAARQAAANGIRIFTVGVGSEEGSEIPLGPGEFVRDPSGKVVQSRLDAERMKEIAAVTGGFYLPLDENTARRLAGEGIGRMKEVEMSASASRRPIERYQWPLAAAIGLLVLQALVGERRRRPAAAVAAACWMLSSGAAWSAPAGLEAYEQGNYEGARTAFEERLKMEPGAPNLQLNAGAAAYRLKDFGKASEYFSRAMLSDDPALRASAEFNLGNTLFRQGEGQQDKEKKITDWKDAIAKYEAALKTRPDYTEAKENKERVEELLKQLEQEQKQDEQKQDKKQDQQQKQDQQKQDQQQDQQQQQNQQQQDQKDQQQQNQQDQKQDQQQGGKDQKQDQQQGQQDKKDQQQGGGQKQKEDQQQGGQKKDQPSADGGQDDQQKQGEQQKQDQQQQGGGEQKQDQQQQGGGEQKQQDQQGGEGDQKQEGAKGEEQKDQGQPQQPKDEGREGQQGDQKKDEPKEGEGREGEQEKEGEEGESEPRDQGGSSGARPEPGQSGDKPAPVPQQAGEKKEGELRGSAAAAGEGGAEQAAAAAAEAEEEVEGQMNASQARALLRSLQSEEEQVDLSERRTFQDVSRDW